MKDSKLAGIFRLLTKQELKSFEKYMNSPFFSFRRDVRGYFHVLRKYHPEFEISSERFFNELYPGKKYNERTLKNLASQMVQMAEEFIALSAFKKQKRLQTKLLAKEYMQRGNDKLFEQTAGKQEKIISSGHFDSTEAFSLDEELLWMKTEYYNLRNDYGNSIKYKLQYTDHATASFLIKFLRSMCDRVAALSYNIKYQTPLIKIFTENIDFNAIVSSDSISETKYSTILKIYFLAFKSITEFSKEEYYFGFKDLLYRNINLFSFPERFLFFNDLTSCCVNNRNEGNHKFAKEQMQVYKDMMELDAWSETEGGWLVIVLYRNIMFMALVQREYEWLEEFIKKHSDKVHPENRENMKNYAMAHLYFETGRLEEALKYSSKVQYDFFAYKLDIKHLLLKIYYELDLFDHAYSLSDTYKHFLRESKEFDEFHQKWHEGFITVYMRLLKAKSSVNPLEAEFIANEMQKMNYVLAKDWLNVQIKNLANLKS